MVSSAVLLHPHPHKHTVIKCRHFFSWSLTHIIKCILFSPPPPPPSLFTYTCNCQMQFFSFTLCLHLSHILSLLVSHTHIHTHIYTLLVSGEESQEVTRGGRRRVWESGLTWMLYTEACTSRQRSREWREWTREWRDQKWSHRQTPQWTMLSWPGYSRTAQSHGLKQEKTCHMYFYNHQKEGKVTKPKTEKVIAKKTVKNK